MAGTARINACGDSRLRGLRSRKPIGFRQWVVHRLRDNDYLDEIGCTYTVIPQENSRRW